MSTKSRELILNAASELMRKGQRATTANIEKITGIKPQSISAHIRRLQERGEWDYDRLGDPNSSQPLPKQQENGPPPSRTFSLERDPAGFSITEDDEEVNELQFITRTLNDLDNMAPSARRRVWMYLKERAEEEYPEIKVVWQ